MKNMEVGQMGIQMDRSNEVLRSNIDIIYVKSLRIGFF